MALGGSLANYDINKLSDEMEKLGKEEHTFRKILIFMLSFPYWILIGGGINIKSETNIAKFITERKKGKNKRSE